VEKEELDKTGVEGNGTDAALIMACSVKEPRWFPSLHICSLLIPQQMNHKMHRRWIEPYSCCVYISKGVNSFV